MSTLAKLKPKSYTKTKKTPFTRLTKFHWVKEQLGFTVMREFILYNTYTIRYNMFHYYRIHKN